MIGFATPWIFGAALAAALAITALHLLSVRTPRTVLLPTARFVPARDVRAVAREARPNDLVLLAVRVLALLAAGAALAGVRCGTTGVRRMALVVADRRLQADSAALRGRLVGSERARAAAGASAGAASSAAEGEVSAPTLVWVSGLDDDPGRAIPAAIRVAARAAQTQPSLASVSLAVVMPASVRSRDGWDAWRTEWPAAIRLISATDTGAGAGAAAATTAPVEAVEDGGGRDRGVDGQTDVVRAAFAARGARVADGVRVRVRLVRGAPRDAGAEAPRGGRAAPDVGRVTVVWPVDGVPAGWRAVGRADSVGALTAAGTVLVAPWRRTALPPPLSADVVAIAWWGDGVPAAIERREGARAEGAICTREVAVVVPAGSDLLLAPSADGLLRALQAPCGGVRVAAPREVAATGASGAASDAASGTLVPADRFREASLVRRVTQPTWLGPLLLIVALGALLVEPLLRRDNADSAS